MICRKCGYKWSPRVTSPKRCPRCGKWLIPRPAGYEELTKFFPTTKYIRGMPSVRTSDGYLVPWTDEAIVNQLIRETRLAHEIFGIHPMSKADAVEIAREARSRISDMRPKFISGPLIRETVNNILLEWSSLHPEYQIYRNILTRVGTPVFDAYEIDIGRGWEAKENANLQPNPETAHKKKADRLSKEEYLLLMDPHISTAHIQGDIHIHDLEYFGTRPFCQDWDLRYFLYHGLLPDGMGFKSSVAGPAKHPEVAVLHSVKVLAAGQTNFSGGQGFMYYTLFLAPFMRGLPYERVKQLAQMMFYELTQTYVTRGGQLVFSNIQLPMGVPKIWEDKPVVAYGQVGPDTYGDYEEEVGTFFRAINDVALQGDYWGKPFNFPKMEEYVSPEFFNSKYDDSWLLVHKAIAKFGVPYLDNMFPAYRGFGKGVSCYQCCAYNFVSTPELDGRFDEKMNFVDGEHFSLGGWQVVSINMPRLAYRANGDYERLKSEARRCMDLAVEVFKVKRRWMEIMMKNSRIPFAVQRPRDPRTGKQSPPAVDFEELVYVIGVIGVNEMVQHFTGHQLHEHKDAVKLALRLLIDMHKYCKELEEKTGMSIRLARTPAESSPQRLAIADLCSPDFRDLAKNVVKGDIKRAKEMVRRGLRRDAPIYYSNGTHTYVGAQIPLSSKVDIEQKFFPALAGGNIFHVWLGEAYPDPEGLFRLTKKIVTKTQVGYFAYTKDMTVCGACNKVSFGLLDKCSYCNSGDVRWWSRVTGYYTDVKGWNEGKRAELLDRYRISI